MAETSVGQHLTAEWLAGLVAASASIDGGQRSGVVEVTIGKSEKAVLDIVDGRVVGPGDPEAVAVTVPVTADQLAAFSAGSESVAQAYMRGDVKPVGSTGALLAFVELFERAEFRPALSAD